MNRPPARLLSSAALLLGLLLMAIRGANAQSRVVAGRVQDSTSALPIPGAVIQAFAVDGRVLGRALSDGNGGFAFRLDDGPGIQLRVQRIGFRPRLVPLDGSTTPLVIALRQLPAFLDPVRVVAAQCRRQGRSSPTGLIEQARAGLLASIVAQDVNPAAMTRARYERRREGSEGRIVHQRVRMDSLADGRKAFGAVNDAEGFLRRGFLEEADGVQTYFAPDAETLLDEAFTRGYCFRVMPADRSRPRQVGLGFEAAGTLAGRVDVAGALWIDTLARELRSIEFEYRALPPILQSQRPGGRLEFTTLPNGISLVTRWHLDLAGVQIDTVRNPRLRRPQPLLRRFRMESGGQLLRAAWEDGTEFRAALGTFVGQATWTGGRPASGVRYALRNSPYVGVSDSSGRVLIEDVLPGLYQVMVVDDDLLSVGLGIETAIEIDVLRDTVRRALPALSADDYVIARCEANAAYNPDADRTFLLARAVWDDGTPVAGARWSIRIRGSEDGGYIERDAESGADGVLPLCQGLERGEEVELLVATPNAMGPVVRRRLEKPTTVVPVIFARP